MKKQQTRAFTLVELIIVITILAILATIWFMSYQSYTADARDANRTTSLKEIWKWIEIYEIKNSKLPMPDDYITIYLSWIAIWYQWYAWKSTLSNIKASDTKDPLDNSYYTYLVNSDLNYYQVSGFLESSPITAFENNSILDTYASNTDYSNRTIKSFWNELWILLINTWSDINRPLQEKYNSTTFTWIDIKLFTWTLSNWNNIWELKAVFNNKVDDNIVWTWSNLIRLENIYKQKMQILMTSCPNGWNELWLFWWRFWLSSNITTNLSWVNQNYKVCEWDNFISSSQIVMTNCPNAWNDLWLFWRKAWTTNITTYMSGITQNYKVCEWNSFVSLSQIVMTNCPIWWNDLWLFWWKAWTTIGITNLSWVTQNYKICEKK